MDVNVLSYCKMPITEHCFKD